MWISRKEYENLMEENELLQRNIERRRITGLDLIEQNQILLKENLRMKKQLEELQVKYADEVKKNFELASYLSENKND